MVRTALSSLILAVVVTATLVTTAPAASADNLVSGTIPGTELFPEEARWLRDVQDWKRQARADYRFAQEYGDRAFMAEIKQAFNDVVQREKQVRARLRRADTVVTMWGDAPQYIDRARAAAWLAQTGLWTHRHMHFWVENGVLIGSEAAPRYYQDEGRMQARGARPAAQQPPTDRTHPAGVSRQNPFDVGNAGSGRRPQGGGSGGQAPGGFQPIGYGHRPGEKPAAGRKPAAKPSTKPTATHGRTPGAQAPRPRQLTAEEHRRLHELTGGHASGGNGGGLFGVGNAHRRR